MRSEKAKAIVPVEKYKIINAPRIVTGKTKENKFNCGADLVIIPAETLIISIIPTTGNIIKEAATNMEPAAFIPAPINTIGGGIEPMGSIEKLSKKTRSIKRCPSNETNKTIKNT